MDPAYVEAIQQIKFADKDKFQLAEQAKSHGNMLFQYGKKNPHQYHNAIVSYNVSCVWSPALSILCTANVQKACHAHHVYGRS